jgi:glycerol uptake facilitator-like aquaporin
MAQQDTATGVGKQADLTLNYKHHEGGICTGYGRFKLKDVQVASAEFFGTFFLALTIAGSGDTEASDIVPYGIGLGLAALVFTTGPVSGGMLNPAVCNT